MQTEKEEAGMDPNNGTSAEDHGRSEARLNRSSTKHQSYSTKSDSALPPLDANNLNNPTSARSSSVGDAVRPQAIDRSHVGGLPQIASSGYHMPPEVLGQQEEDDDDDSTRRRRKNENNESSSSSRRQQRTSSGQQRRPTVLSSVNSKARKRCQKAIKATKSHAASKAAAAQVAAAEEETTTASSTENDVKQNTTTTSKILDSSVFTFLTYRGMEVIFGCISPYQVVGVCSRTHFLFQTLDLASEDEESPIVSISSNSHSGMIVIAHEDGTVQTYVPIPTNTSNDIDPSTSSSDEEGKQQQQQQQQHLPAATGTTSGRCLTFGRFRWVDGCQINAGEVFYQHKEAVLFRDRRNAKPGQLVDISSSTDQKLLIAHRNQLAVFDASLSSSSKTTGGVATSEKMQQQQTQNNNVETMVMPASTCPDAAALLWTTMLPSNIVTAKMSGDGQALVVVLDRDEENGARTFIHDMEDGSNNVPGMEGTSLGMVYKPGPFLHHESPVTKISFRGMGHLTSSSMTRDDEGDGNDLLLTYCEKDSSVRIFNQNNWQQLMFWVTPPNSRADWIQGSSAFTLGDLESVKKPKNSNNTNNPGSRSPSRRPSISSATDSSGGGGINNNLANVRTIGAGTPTTAAGAWIAEITFRNAYPALRLSRLSYMKRGNDDSQPVHFESVAAILPAGSISPKSILHSDDMGLAIQGIWPAWNPWLSETTGVETDDSLRGSAMQFLGLSSLPPTTGPYFGENYLGGTHSPPIELRIVASQPKAGSIVLMEFPLWGDEDFGAMELGSPLRSVLSLADTLALKPKNGKTTPINRQSGISMEYESSRLCAKIESDGRSISLLWRKPGSMSLNRNGSTSEGTRNSTLLDSPEPKVPEVWNDLSAIPVPLALPSLLFPKHMDHETIAYISWFPDPSYGGPPLLLAATISGTILVFELPPLWCAREPVMPNYDPFNAGSSTGSLRDDEYDASARESFSDDVEGSETGRQEYEVQVTPDTDFGLGLRLESPMDGMPAVAGSFKKNPINGGMLPAERTGMIVLGDEILSVNGVLLEHMTFDDIIATVRHVGTEIGPGEPLTLRFRPAPTSISRRNSEALHESFNSRPQDGVPGPEAESSKTSWSRVGSKTDQLVKKPSGGSFVDMQEAQQEFGRLVSRIRQCLPSAQKEDFTDRLLILPWGHGIGAADSNDLLGVALLVVSTGIEIAFKRLELPVSGGPAKSRSIDLGKVTMTNSKVGDGKDLPSPRSILKIISVENVGPKRCFVVIDNCGFARLVVLEIRKSTSTMSTPFNVSFAQYELCDLGQNHGILHFRAASASLFAVATKEAHGFSRVISIWTARADVTARKLEADGVIRDELLGQDYQQSAIEVESSNEESDIVDFCFLTTGYLDAFPALLVFLGSEVVVYQKRGSGTKWVPLVRLEYPQIPGSVVPNSPFASLHRSKSLWATNPIDSYPQITRCIRSILPSHDESRYIITDWHPENLLSLLCTDDRGAKVALKLHVEEVLYWLTDNPESDDTARAQTADSPLCVVPFVSTGGQSLLGSSDDIPSTPHDASSLMSQVNLGGQQLRSPDNDRLARMQKLTTAIDAIFQEEDKVELTGKSHEFKVAMSQHQEAYEYESSLLSNLTKLNSGELRVLRAIATLVADPPDYRKLDAPGQLALTISRLHTSLKDTSGKEKSKAASKKTNSPAKSNTYAFLRRLPYNASGNKAKLPPRHASAGCVAALLSDYQGLLLDCIRIPGKKLDWTTIREARAPFWLRSDEKLRQLSEEIGQNQYRESRDILKSAIFFIVAGKKRTLTNLAAADRTASGSKFFKFLTSFDFSSDRGRSAAEKNAFSLLRKNQYESAAAFFLLAEPPCLKSAVETIATKMEDLELAFLVARLVGGGSPSGANGGFAPAGFGGFGGMLGGGGGYAGPGVVDSGESTKDNERYVDWKPCLKKGAVELLRDRGLPESYDDPCFSAVQLLWLGRPDEASHWLSGLVGSPDGLIPSFLENAELPTMNQASTSLTRSLDPAMTMVNRFVGFVSGPLLLNAMSATPRTQMATSLLVSECLSRRGIELAAMRCILNNIDPLNFDEASANCSPQQDDTAKSQPGKNAITSGSSVTQPISSIFDDYSSAGPVKSKNQNNRTASGELSSEIFDSFEVPPTDRLPSLVVPKSEPQMSSSIFDSFDVPSTKKKSPEPAVASSIFDAYDVPPQKAPEPAVASSIFDTYDGPPKKTPELAATSSIFDAYDGPPKKTPEPAETPSIFDAYNGPPKKTPAPAATSSIFDGYDGPLPSSRQKTVANETRPKSIFDSYDMPTPQKTPAKPATSSSIFDAYDTTPSLSSQKKTTLTPSSIQGASEPDPMVVPDGPIRPPPKIWIEWRDHLLLLSAARRLVREITSIGFRFQGGVFEPDMHGHGIGLQIPKSAAQVLQFHCDGEALVQEVEDCVRNISEMCVCDAEILVNRALQLIQSPYHFHRVCFAVLLRLSLQQVDQAEDIVRSISQLLIEMCSSVSLTSDTVSSRESNMARSSSFYVSKSAAHLSWQLELCLWMHRGGALPLSGDVLNEAICAVRIGLLVAGWNQDFECIETMLQQPPDCLMDHDVGRQLWTSLKVISTSSVGEKRHNGSSSGGWEFLVDCRRSEATDILRPRPTGCFIIRPHPDDHGVFTLSFKTNLVPSGTDTASQDKESKHINGNNSTPKTKEKTVKRDDVVQHAIIRLSETGFRCGSFGPFATLMKLLEAVSSSLPFNLRFDLPPTEGVIKEEGSKPSPNAALFRKLGLATSETEILHPPLDASSASHVDDQKADAPVDTGESDHSEATKKEMTNTERRMKFGFFLELLILSETRKQLSSVAAAKYDNFATISCDEADSVGSVSDRSIEMSAEQEFAVAARILRPLLTWCQIIEIGIVDDLAPQLKEVSPISVAVSPVTLNASETAIEISTSAASGGVHGGDAVMRRMIQPGSGVEFRTLRLGDAGETAMVVLFSKKEAIGWFLDHGVEKTEEDALKRLGMMEKSRVIEPIDLKTLAPKAYRKTSKGDGDDEGSSKNEEEAIKAIRYRLVDPWEVEPLESREAETRGASLGRHRFLAFSLNKVSASSADAFRTIGGRDALELWATGRGGVSLTKAFATVHSPWERAAGGDLHLHNGVVSEPVPYANSIRQHLYRNALFRRMDLPQRFMALIQVELLDLKNLTGPGGALNMNVYSLLRLKRRSKSNAPLTVKARTLDSVSTTPMKLGKSTGPNAPASWGTLVRFRFPLPECTAADGRSHDGDREALFKGPPSVLQVSVYEKKFMGDSLLGGADVPLDGLIAGGQLEEWVPLSTERDGINWFARMRLTLRFELMCLSSDAECGEGIDELAPSVGLKRIKQLSSIGGSSLEDLKKSISTPDLLGYFESMIY